MFNKKYDKSRMIDVPHDEFLQYAGGDADASYRLAGVLARLAMQDERHYNRYRTVAMPMMEVFQNVTEPAGVLIDQVELERFGETLRQNSVELYDDLIRQVPPPVRRRMMEWATLKKKTPREAMSFSRPDFVREVLFSRDGFNLRPRVFTESTRKLPPDQQIPSTSVKDHLPYFDDSSFVLQLIDYQKMTKMAGTYVGLRETPDGPTGFWKYIAPDGCIHPSFMLHRTLTGRTNSADPNGQNFPKRSKLARAYRRIFKAKAGKVFIEADLSQAELRIAAWMSGDPVMLEIYRQAGDIHVATACMIVGMSPEVFLQQSKEFQKEKRQQAKAVNLGFVGVPGRGCVEQISMSIPQ